MKDKMTNKQKIVMLARWICGQYYYTKSAKEIM